MHIYKHTHARTHARTHTHTVYTYTIYSEQNWSATADFLLKRFLFRERLV